MSLVYTFFLTRTCVLKITRRLRDAECVPTHVRRYLVEHDGREERKACPGVEDARHEYDAEAAIDRVAAVVEQQAQRGGRAGASRLQACHIIKYMRTLPKRRHPTRSKRFKFLAGVSCLHIYCCLTRQSCEEEVVKSFRF